MRIFSSCLLLPYTHSKDCGTGLRQQIGTSVLWLSLVDLNEKPQMSLPKFVFSVATDIILVLTDAQKEARVNSEPARSGSQL